MSNFEKRVTLARRRSMRRWARGLRYGGYVGGMLTGAAGMLFLLAVITA